jgi:hypothetical protein
VVDERRGRRLLQRVSEDFAYLAERARDDRGAIRTDPDRLAALKYRFVTAIEGCLNVAQPTTSASSRSSITADLESFVRAVSRWIG